MASYKVTSDRVAGYAVGEIISDVEGLNVDALIEGGHIEPVTAKRAEKKEDI